MVAKAEHLDKLSNPRFVVVLIEAEQINGDMRYEELYFQRGDMENRIKEQRLWLFADRTSANKIRANQVRLYFSSAAYLLLQALRRLGLQGTQMATVQCHTIRLKLLKLGAQAKITVPKAWISRAGGYFYIDLFCQVCGNLQSVPLQD